MKNYASKFLLSILIVSLSAGMGYAEEGAELTAGRWYKTLEAGLNLTQSAYSDNWKGGENGSVAWTANMNATAQRLYVNDLNWLNSLKLRFGQTHQQRLDSDGEKHWARPEKSEDKIDFESILRLQKGWELDPYVSGRLESQFMDVKAAAGKTLLFNPVTTKESAGVSHKFLDRADEMMLTRFGLTSRQSYRRRFTSVGSDATTGELSHDGGVEFQADWRLKLSERVAWVSKLSVYKPFTWSKASVFEKISADSLAAVGIDTDIKDLTTSTDIGWENTFTTQVSKWIAVNLYVEFVYDQYDNSVVPLTEGAGQLTNPADVSAAVRKKGQYKQTIAIGITYRFL